MKKDEAQPKKIIKMILTSYSQAHERLFRKRIGRNTPQHAAILNENAQSHLGTLQFWGKNAQSHLGTLQFRVENAQSHLGTMQFRGENAQSHLGT
ncbi:hypothetical protein, partial [Prevotella sp. HJM029]|uniref:hypothetical protein n=1 Tax=Prevotella sp. HJM029 TaxID=1433844 RepID=UPI001C11975D